MTAGRLYRGALAVFVALSVTDFVQTYFLIHNGGGAVYEANPVAAPWLERYGWDGLAAYKLGAVLIVVGAVVAMAQRDRRVAVGVAALGCAAVLSVTLYSDGLIKDGPGRRAPGDDLPPPAIGPSEWYLARPPVAQRWVLPDQPTGGGPTVAN